MSDKQTLCELCGDPMPPGEQIFKYHGYSGPCPKPRLPKPEADKSRTKLLAELEEVEEYFAHRRRLQDPEDGAAPAGTEVMTTALPKAEG